VPQTKVVENIQIFLHAKFHIFLGPLSISSNIILTCLKDQNSKRKLNWKMGVRPFSPRRHSAAVPPGPISHASGPLPFPTPQSLPLGAHQSVPSVLQIPELSARVSPVAPILAAAVLHHITWSLPSLPPCCTGRPPSSPLCHHDVDTKHPATRIHAASLLPPPLLAHPSSL
jgi:hypothetical protein